MAKDKFKTPSRTSPKGSSRGCLCEDKKTYHVDCCDGSLQAQGIGSPVNALDSVVNRTIIPERTIGN